MKLTIPFIVISMLSSIWVTTDSITTKGGDIDFLTSEGLEIFSEGHISTGLYERDIAINADGNLIIYTLGNYKQTKRCLVRTMMNESKWTEPEILNISGTYQDIEPFFSENGTRLFFASDRPMAGDSIAGDYNIWYSDRAADGDWNTPIALGSEINTDEDEFYPSLSKNNNLYFTSTRPDGHGREDIFMSRFENGSYNKAEVLGKAVNTKVFEFNAFINPDEDLLIFSSYGRPDGLGGGDLYYSKKGVDGQWSASKNMGEKINSNKIDYCPFVDAHNDMFYFTSERQIDSSNAIESIDELKINANSVGNGMGDIYRINMEEIDW